MIRKTLLAIGIAALVFGLSPVVPAQAAVVLQGCDERRAASGWGVICLFDGTEFGKGSWRVYDLRVIRQQAGSCLTLDSAFRNVTSSFVHNPSFTGQAALTGARLRFWPGAYCTGSPVPTWAADVERADNDLRTTVRYGNISNLIDSVSLAG